MLSSDFNFIHHEEYLIEAHSAVPFNIKDTIYGPIKSQTQVEMSCFEQLRQTILELFYQYHESVMPYVRFIDIHNEVGFEVSLLDMDANQTTFVNLGGQGNSNRIVGFLIPVSHVNQTLHFPCHSLDVTIKKDSVYIIPSNMTYRFKLKPKEELSALCFFITVPIEKK